MAGRGWIFKCCTTLFGCSILNRS
ncbi:hypothetical protein KP509_12G089900 [Ceratopteris richardii]|uniref:Uncharacterized protein n=1 Tax=Ceratopteris richardii TaxID=49495 RepID=A0A8T2TP03_CERRI|nr:hypothetical protein KP509_12G089900 [Ceratopteris richardii]